MPLVVTVAFAAPPGCVKEHTSQGDESGFQRCPNIRRTLILSADWLFAGVHHVALSFICSGNEAAGCVGGVSLKEQLTQQGRTNGWRAITSSRHDATESKSG